MGLITDYFKNKRAEDWMHAGKDETKKRAIRKAAHGNAARPVKRNGSNHGEQRDPPRSY